jgi:A/G-specific adenine glycosylase
MADFHLLIKDWYRLNKRALPWRSTKDPYSIWLSEIILQQTRVDQGMAYYLKFLENYPTIQDLARADEQEVLNHWQGLGYYSRARNLHATANYISNELKGIFPSNFKELLKLKGIGEYTAAAIASFSFKEPVAVVDGNVYRVLSRVFDIETPIDSLEGKKQFSQLAQALISTTNPDTHNQAIMEFGALHCTPANPKCESCPLISMCIAFDKKTVSERPIKSKKTKVRDRYFHYLIFEDENHFFIYQRTQKDIWQNMYQFPLIETDMKKELNQFSPFTNAQPITISPEITHILTHQKIHTLFYHFPASSIIYDTNLLKISKQDFSDFPIPRVIDRYLESL